MSSRESGSSSCSDDSEFNFLPGYVVEFEEEDERPTRDEATSQKEGIKPYADEPIAGEEWPAEYNQFEAKQKEFELKLQTRYDGKEQLHLW